MTYRLEHRLPTVPEYKHLCESVGWGQIMNLNVAKQAIDHSVAGVVIDDERGQVIAMGRIVGDGAIYYYIQDVVVASDYQRSGLGQGNRIWIDFNFSRAWPATSPYDVAIYQYLL